MKIPEIHLNIIMLTMAVCGLSSCDTKHDDNDICRIIQQEQQKQSAVAADNAQYIDVLSYFDMDCPIEYHYLPVLYDKELDAWYITSDLNEARKVVLVPHEERYIGLHHLFRYYGKATTLNTFEQHRSHLLAFRDKSIPEKPRSQVSLLIQHYDQKSVVLAVEVFGDFILKTKDDQIIFGEFSTSIFHLLEMLRPVVSKNSADDN